MWLWAAHPRSYSLPRWECTMTNLSTLWPLHTLAVCSVGLLCMVLGWIFGHTSSGEHTQAFQQSGPAGVDCGHAGGLRSHTVCTGGFRNSCVSANQSAPGAYYFPCLKLPGKARSMLSPAGPWGQRHQLLYKWYTKPRKGDASCFQGPGSECSALSFFFSC